MLDRLASGVWLVEGDCHLPIILPSLSSLERTGSLSSVRVQQWRAMMALSSPQATPSRMLMDPAWNVRGCFCGGRNLAREVGGRHGACSACRRIEFSAMNLMWNREWPRSVAAQATAVAAARRSSVAASCTTEYIVSARGILLAD